MLYSYDVYEKITCNYASRYLVTTVKKVRAFQRTERERERERERRKKA